jgi:hypothetical protein
LKDFLRRRVASVKPSAPRTGPGLVFVDARAEQGIVRTVGSGSTLEMTCGTAVALIRFA